MKLLLTILLVLTPASAVLCQASRFSLSDSIRYSDEITSGTAIVLRVGETVIDTIDALFGIQPINSSTVIYNRVQIRSQNGSGNTVEGSPIEFVLWKNGKKSSLKQSLRYFDDWFSSPQVIGSGVYYWGLKRDARSDSLAVFALRYDPATSDLDSMYLFTDLLETDNPGFFFFPKREAGGVRFQYEYSGWIIDSAFTVKTSIK